MSTTTLDKSSLESVLGFRVNKFDLYIPVFTHKSAMRFVGGDSYERYEFMGDAVINFVVAKLLYDMFPQADEGFLSKVRTKLVSGKCLSDLSFKLGLHRFVKMSERSLKSGYNTKPRILEDVFESLVGCVYLDLGLVSAKTFLLSVYQRFIDFTDILRNTNYKDGLMRYAHARGVPLPDYVIVASTPQWFVIDAVVHGVAGRGAGPSKKMAEQEAAKQLLQKLGCLNAAGDVDEASVVPRTSVPCNYSSNTGDGARSVVCA